MKKITLTLLLVFISHALVAQWAQVGSDIDGEAELDYSGHSVSLSADGSIVAIGAPTNDGNANDSGHVRIYQNLGGTWTQIGNDIDGEAELDNSGHSVSLSANGSIVAIGAPYNDGNGGNSGHVRIYENQSGTWTQVGNDIDGEAASDNSGWSVSLSADGSIVAISAIRNDGNGGSNSGHVRVYQNQSGTWTQVGNDIDGEAADDLSGSSVSLSADGNIVAIGAFSNDGNGGNSGHVRIYENQSGTWTQIGNDIDGEAASDYFGYSVSLSADGNVVAISALYNDGNGSDSGHVRIYQNQSGTWTQVGNDIDGEAAGDRLGRSVSLSTDGGILAISAPNNDGNGNNSGHVRVYQNQSGIWTQLGNDIDGEAVDDQSGYSVSLATEGNGVTVAISSINNDDNGYASGHVRVYNDPSIVLAASANNILPNVKLFTLGKQQLKIIGLEDNTHTIKIYSITGKEIYTKHFTTNSTQYLVNLPKVATGIYIAKLYNKNGSKVEKIVLD